LVAGILLATTLYALFHTTPTCFDGTKNGDERGIDCGGSCKLLCTSEALTPVVLWSKVFNISDDLYTATAYIQNPNINSKNPLVTYKFSLFDANNKLITVREGNTSIPKNKKFAVFETGFILKSAKPKSARFEFTGFSQWEKDTKVEPEVTVKNSTLLFASTTPRVTGTIHNESLSEDVSYVELDALVFDADQNVIGTSRTYIDNLRANSSQDFIFTWPQPLSADASFVTVIYRQLDSQ
jgi:hypothetical protein